MQSRLKHFLTNYKGAISLLEVFIAAAIAAIAYYSFTNMYEYDHDNVSRIESKWQAQLMAESIASTISSLKVEKMYEYIMNDSLLVKHQYSTSSNTQPDVTNSNTLPARHQWLNTWQKLSPRIISVSFELNVYDKNINDTDSSTQMENKSGSCFNSLDHFKRCHKKITSVVVYNFKKEDSSGPNNVEQTANWTIWIMGKELPDLY